MILLDTDIASALAKANALKPILELYKGKAYITPEVYEELQAPLDHGYKYPKRIFKQIRVLDTKPKEQRQYRERLHRNENLGKGELESITVAKNRDYYFISLDKKAIKHAQENNTKTTVFKTILRKLWKEHILTKEEVKQMVNRIEEKDNRKIDTKGVW